VINFKRFFALIRNQVYKNNDEIINGKRREKVKARRQPMRKKCSKQ